MKRCSMCNSKATIGTHDIVGNYWSYCKSCGYSPDYKDKHIVGVDGNGLPMFRKVATG